jgi:hypothetical protein
MVQLQYIHSHNQIFKFALKCLTLINTCSLPPNVVISKHVSLSLLHLELPLCSIYYFLYTMQLINLLHGLQWKLILFSTTKLVKVDLGLGETPTPWASTLLPFFHTMQLINLIPWFAVKIDFIFYHKINQRGFWVTWMCKTFITIAQCNSILIKP